MDYTKLTDFATKDALLSGNPSKLLRGTELDAEFGAIVTAVATKTDDSAAAITGGTIDGTVIGGVTPAATTVSSLTDSGNLTFTGTANRITGDFSNATVANRVMFQTSTVNGPTAISAIPNGTGVQSQIALYSGSDVNNSNVGDIVANNAEVRFRSIAVGTATAVPMTFYTDGSERMRLSTAGALGLGGTNYGTAGQVLQSNGAASAPIWTDVVGIGIGQTLQTMTGSRALGTTYYNTTGKPIEIYVRTTYGAGSNVLTLTVGAGAKIHSGNGSYESFSKISSVVPVGVAYSVTLTSGTAALVDWMELR